MLIRHTSRARGMGNCLDRDDTGHTEDADGPLLPQGQDLRSFTVIVKPSEPSALLRWDPPADCDVTGYDVRFKSLGCAHYTELRVDADQTTCTLRVSDGLKPLNLTQFEVRLVQEGTKGGWSQQARFVGIVINNRVNNIYAYIHRFALQIGTANALPVEWTERGRTTDRYTTFVTGRAPVCFVGDCVRVCVCGGGGGGGGGAGAEWRHMVNANVS